MERHNLVHLLAKRQLDAKEGVRFTRLNNVTDNQIRRLGLEAELDGHSGCVNCLEWSSDGSMLASGSDDFNVVLWEPAKRRHLCTLKSGHAGNIFSVKFLPQTSDSMLVSAAADYTARVHDVRNRETTHVFYCHMNRVKRVAVAPDVPYMFWTAAEDGTVMQFDLRQPHTCRRQDGPCKTVLVNLVRQLGGDAEAKCLAINPVFPEQLAVGANDPYVRVYDRRMLSLTNSPHPVVQHGPAQLSPPPPDPYTLPAGCVKYFVAGHLPQKHAEFRRRFRSLASTYITFSPNGREVLTNLGGEQIYMFNTAETKQSTRSFNMKQLQQASTLLANSAINGISYPEKPPNAPEHSFYKLIKLADRCQQLKSQANSMYLEGKYTEAIDLYSKALVLYPHTAVLYGNRAAAFMKRRWDGDVYAALRDCYEALHLDPTHLKACFRLCRCLFELKWMNEAIKAMNFFKKNFPQAASNRQTKDLENQINFWVQDAATADNPLTGTEEEQKLQEAALDYSSRFCGHCNMTTDIKEANFFGSNGQYVVAGSDDGSIFVWETATTKLVRILKGDSSIVNCLQPHPTTCLLATSGIDSLVRLWSPLPEDLQNERLVTDVGQCTARNQRRMNTDPLQVMLLNMGQRLYEEPDDSDDERTADAAAGGGGSSSSHGVAAAARGAAASDDDSADSSPHITLMKYCHQS